MGLDHYGRVLVIAPHPDDEVLGCGGTIARMVDEGLEVHVAVVTIGKPPDYCAESVARVQDEARRAHALLGVRQTHVLDYPAAGLDRVPASELNAGVAHVIREVRPDTLFLPFLGDIHRDHQLAFLAAMVAARPRDGQAPSRILACETLSETNWYAAPTTPAFVPNVFIDISGTLERKLDAFHDRGSGAVARVDCLPPRGRSFRLRPHDRAIGTQPRFPAFEQGVMGVFVCLAGTA